MGPLHLESMDAPARWMSTHAAGPRWDIRPCRMCTVCRGVNVKWVGIGQLLAAACKLSCMRKHDHQNQNNSAADAEDKMKVSRFAVAAVNCRYWIVVALRSAFGRCLKNSARRCAQLRNCGAATVRTAMSAGAAAPTKGSRRGSRREATSAEYWCQTTLSVHRQPVRRGDHRRRCVLYMRSRRTGRARGACRALARGAGLAEGAELEVVGEMVGEVVREVVGLQVRAAMVSMGLAVGGSGQQLATAATAGGATGTTGITINAITGS